MNFSALFLRPSSDQIRPVVQPRNRLRLHQLGRECGRRGGEQQSRENTGECVDLAAHGESPFYSKRSELKHLIKPVAIPATQAATKRPTRTAS